MKVSNQQYADNQNSKDTSDQNRQDGGAMFGKTRNQLCFWQAEPDLRQVIFLIGESYFMQSVQFFAELKLMVLWCKWLIDSIL